MIPIVIFLRKKPKQPNVDFSYNAAYVSTFLASAIFLPPTPSPEDPFP